MRFGDALTAIQTAALTSVKNDNPKKMAIVEGYEKVIVAIQFQSIDGKTPFLYRANDEYKSFIPWRPTQAQMFSDRWELVK